MREIRNHAAALLGGDEPVLVTKHGKVSGLFVPLEDPERIPEDIRRALVDTVGRHLSSLLEAQGINEVEIQEDFDAHRRAGRRR